MPVFGAAVNTYLSVAYAATVTPAVTAGQPLTLVVAALTGNLTLANPTGTPTDGQMLKVRLQQDATGGRTVSFGTAYAFGSDVTTALIPTGANAKWSMGFEWCAADSKWRCVAIARGF